MKFDHSPAWKRGIIHYMAKALGILVHIEGLPHGSSRNIDFSRFENDSSASFGNPASIP